MSIDLFGDHLPEQVEYSLEAAELAQDNASLGVYDASAGMHLGFLNVRWFTCGIN